MTDKKYDNNEEGNYRKSTMKSDVKDKSNSSNHFDDVEVCRDYLRNVCKRERCKFSHPKREENQEIYVFCHDFQNAGCVRVGCRFVHCTVEEEAYYHQHGELLPHVYEAYKKQNSVELSEESYSTCIDYVRGRCQRDSCKFRHVTANDLKTQSSSYQNANGKCHSSEEWYLRFMSERDEDHCCGGDDYRSNGYNNKRICLRDDVPPPSMEHKSCDMIENRTLWMLESENNMLRKRVMELKKKNDELQATNEFLLEQNARMRIGDKTPLSLAAVTVPAVTITNTGSLQHQGPQPQVINALRTAVAASMATVPVSLAAVATTPVSIATVSMAPVQIPPVVTVAQAPGDPSALGPNLNTDSQSLVSYPILNGSTILQGTMQRR